jgi:hypothetical protein
MRTLAPSFDHGFGSITLKNALKFKDSDFELFIENRKSIKDQEIQYYGFKATTASNLVVTLTWYDPPVSLLSGIILVNNLNLDVLVNGKRISGNRIPEDYLNNVEKVVEKVNPNDIIDIVIRGERIITPIQNYALVITGGISKQSNDRTCNGIDYQDATVCGGKGYCSKQDTVRSFSV